MLSALVVDDEFYIRELFKNSIDWAAIGFESVMEADSGSQAIRLARERFPSLVLLDINLPDGDGFAVARELLRLAPKPEIIIITGYERFEFAKKAISFGVHDYLLKPVSDAELANSINGVLRKIAETRKSRQVFDQLVEDISTLLPLVDAQNVAALYEKIDMVPAGRRTENANEIVQNVTRYVKEHLSDPGLSVESVSHSLYLNMSYLSHIFKKAFGKGLHEYILSQRMERAYDMIFQTDKSLCDIAGELGFQNPVYFSKRLKQYYSLTFQQIREIRKKYAVP
jgi:YesN/AraC family two-component response regulator